MSLRFVIVLGIALAAVGFSAARALQQAQLSQDRTVPEPLELSGRSRPSSILPVPVPARDRAAEEVPGASGDSRPLDQDEGAEASVDAKRMLERWIGRAGLANANPDELEVLIKGSRNSLFVQKDRDYLFAVRRLAELQPERAANLWASSTDFRMQADLFLNDWAQKDPTAFASWTLAQTPDVQRASAQVLANQAQADPEKFIGIAASLSASPAGPIAARSAVQGMRGQTKYSDEQVVSYAQSLPAGPIRDAALVETLKGQQTAAEPSPEVLAALERIAPEDARRFGRELTKVADALPAGAARESAFASSLREQADKDPAAAAKRLETLSGTPDYAAAVRGFVEQTARKDPAAAAEWALTIPSSLPLQRISALERAAAAWLKSSPEDARAWVEKAALSDMEYFQLTGRTR